MSNLICEQEVNISGGPLNNRLVKDRANNHPEDKKGSTQLVELGLHWGAVLLFSELRIKECGETQWLTKSSFWLQFVRLNPSLVSRGKRKRADQCNKTVLRCRLDNETDRIRKRTGDISFWHFSKFILTFCIIHWCYVQCVAEDKNKIYT